MNKIDTLRKKYYNGTFTNTFNVEYLAAVLNAVRYEFEVLKKKNSSILTENQIGIIAGIVGDIESMSWVPGDTAYELLKDNRAVVQDRVSNILSLVDVIDNFNKSNEITKCKSQTKK